MNTPNERTILNEVGEQESIWQTKYTLRDLRLLAPGFMSGFVLLIVGSEVSALLGGLLFLSCFGTSALLVWYAPSYRIPDQWVKDVIMYLFKDREQNLYTDNSSESPQSLTKVDQILTNKETSLGKYGAVERSDGAYVGAVKVSPVDLTLARDEVWKDICNEFGEELRKYNFLVQIIKTSRPIDVEKMVAPYRERKQDLDVQANPQLHRLLEVYETAFKQEFDNIGVCRHEYYVLVTATPLEVRIRYQSAVEKLSRLRGGELIRSLAGAQSNMSEKEIKKQQLDLLHKRLRKIETGIGDIADCSSSPVDATTLSTLLEEYWTGETVPSSAQTMDRMPTVPIVQPDYTEEVTFE